MGRIRATLMTLLGAALTALFIWTLSEGGMDGNFALGGALFFAACTIVPFSYLIPAETPDADLDGAITVPNSRARSLAMALALFAVTAAALLMWPMITQSDDWRRFVFVLIPIPCALLGLKFLQWGLSGAPAYRFDKQGVTRYQWGQKTTPWNVVTSVRMLKIRGVEHVVLDVTPEHRRLSGWWSRFSGATGFGDVTLASGACGLSARDLETLVRRFWSGGARQPG